MAHLYTPSAVTQVTYGVGNSGDAPPSPPSGSNISEANLAKVQTSGDSNIWETTDGPGNYGWPYFIATLPIAENGTIQFVVTVRGYNLSRDHTYTDYRVWIWNPDTTAYEALGSNETSVIATITKTYSDLSAYRNGDGNLIIAVDCAKDGDAEEGIAHLYTDYIAVSIINDYHESYASILAANLVI